MSKTAIDAKRGTVFLVDPENLVLVEDRTHHLYDERVHMPVDQSLVESIKLHGVLQPVRVQKDGEKLLVVVGRQRVKASRMVRKTDKDFRIPVLLTKGDDAGMAEEMIIENEHRTGDSPMTKINKAVRLLKLGRDEAEVAMCFRIGVPMLKTWLKVADLAPAVQKAIDERKVPLFETVRRLSDLDREKQLEALADMGKTGASAEEASVKHGGKRTKKQKGVSRARMKKVLDGSLNSTVLKERAVLSWAIGDFDDADLAKAIPGFKKALGIE